MSLKQTSVRPRRKNQNAKVTIKLDNPDLTTIVPMSHPNANVMHRVIKKAVNGVASPKPNGKPHLSIMAIDIPAKAIIGPIDKSNSPPIINIAAAIAIIPRLAETSKKC